MCHTANCNKLLPFNWFVPALLEGCRGGVMYLLKNVVYFYDAKINENS